MESQAQREMVAGELLPENPLVSANKHNLRLRNATVSVLWHWHLSVQAAATEVKNKCVYYKCSKIVPLRAIALLSSPSPPQQPCRLLQIPWRMNFNFKRASSG